MRTLAIVDDDLRDGDAEETEKPLVRRDQAVVHVVRPHLGDRMPTLEAEPDNTSRRSK